MQLTILIVPHITDGQVKDRSKLCSMFPGRMKHTFKITEFSPQTCDQMALINNASKYG